MIKKLTKFGRSTLSVILCLTMLLTTFCFFDIGSVISNAMVTVTENNKMKGSLSSQFMYAPEIAYLKPGSSAFQYFSNYDPATGKAISTNDATSRLEFDYKGATEIAIGVNRVYYKNGENDVDFSGTLKINNVTVTQNKVAYNATTSTSFSSIASSASGAISVTLNASQCSLTGAATGTTYYIQWVFRYKVDGAYHFAFMYTGVYVPLLDQAGTSTSQRYIKSGSNPTENHSWSFITGAMKYSGGNRKSQFLGTTANTLLAAPLVSFVGRAQNENNYTIPCGDGQALNENNFSSSQTPYNTFVYNRPKRGSNELYYDTTSISVPSSYSGTVAGNVSITNTGDGVIGSGITLGMAYIVVDTSRYTNYNQIPYLSAGYAQFYHDLDGNGNKLNSIKSVKRYNKGSSTSIAYDGTIYCDVDTSNYTDHDSYSVARGLYKFNGSVIDGLVTFDTWFYNGYKHFVGYTESIGVHHYNGLYTETVNKQTLRTVYNDASHSHIDYKTYSSGYSAYYTELKSVAETLCNPQLYSKTTTSLSGTASGSVKAIETSIINSTTTADNYVYFYVPEVIYLTPGKTTFQYYSDMSSVSLSNGVCTPTVNSANKDTTGNIYFYYKNASKVKITQSGASSVSLSGGNVTSFNSYVNTSQSAVTTANISGGSVSSAASTYITWTATYVEDNIEKTVTAKSYVYSPYTSAFSAAARYKCSDGTNHFCDSFAYLSGVHSITGMNDVNRYASATNLTPLLGRLKEPVNNTHMTPDGTWIDGSSTSNAYASRFSDDSGSSDRVVVAHAGTGKIYVDTSRFTDLNKIPNLTFGFGVTDRQNANELYYFVADYTGINTRGNGSTTSHFDEWNRTPNYVMWGNKNTKQTVSEGMKYNNGVVPGTNTLSTTDGTENKVIGTQVYTYQSGDRALNALYLHLDIVRANRSGLRKAVEYAAKYSYALQAEYFNGSTQWTNYTTALANAQNALTKVDGTANFGIFPEGNVAGSGLAKTLKDAVDVLLNANRGTAPRNTNNYTATQKNVGLVANSNGTFTVAAIAEAASDGTASISKTFKAYDKVEFSAEQYEGYKYVGYIKGGASSNGDAFSATDYNNMVNSTDPVSKSKNETLTFGNAKNVNYSYTFYYILNPDVLFDNEFDFDQWALKATFSGAYSFDMATNTATITNPGTSTDYSTSNINGTGSYYMNVLPNHTYRISMKVKMGSTAGTVDYMAFAFRDANRSNPSVGTSPYYSRPSISLAANAEGTLTSEFKIPSDASYMTLRLGLRTASITASFSDIYIQDITTPGGFKDDVTDATPHANLSLISGSQIGNVASISRTGYAFDGWYNNQDSTGNGTGTKYTSTSTVGNSNLRLYAKWTVAPELMFDNEFRFDNITASDIASGANNSTFDIDYGSNKLRLNAKGADAYTGQWYGIKSGAFAVTPGHTYRIRTTVKNTSSSAKYAVVYIFCFADSNLNSTDTNGNRKSVGVTVASGAESTIDFYYTVQTGRYYGALRFGINDSANGDTAEFSNIYVQDTTSPGGVADDVTPADPINKVKLPGETVGSLADIERSGYTFTGWNTAKNGTGTTYTESTKMPSSNTQLWSQWEVNSYTITFAPNGGSVTPTSKTFTINDSISLPTPTRTGYTFSGWKVTEKADVSNWTLNDVYTGTSIPAGKYGNVTLTAQWTANKITVKFSGNGATGGATADQVFTYDSAQALRANGFTRAYTVTYNGNFSGKTPTLGATSQTATYTFKNWNNAAAGNGSYTYTNGQTVTNPNGATSGTTYLYAQWNSASVKLPTATLPGYTFLGWYDAATGGNKIGGAGDSYTPTAAKTLYAHWSANAITVKFSGNGATSGSMTDQVFTYDTAQALKSNGFSRAYTVTYNGNFSGKTPTLGATSQTATYTFKNWNNAAAGNGSYTYTNGQTVTNPNGATSGTTYLYAQWNSASVKLPTATLPGYTFLGWYDAATGGNKIGGAGDSYTPTAAKTLYAHWSANAITVKFSGNGATSGSMTDQVFTYDTAQALKSNGFSRAYTVTYNGNFSGKTPTLGATSQTATYTFKNWNNAAAGNGSYTYTNGQTVTNPNGATSGTTYLYAQWNSASVKLPTATLPGYTFLGWYDAATGGNKIGGAGDSYTPTAAKTLYAHWSANAITVKFSGNGATSGSMTDQVFTYDTAQALKSNGFSRAYTVTYNGNFSGKTPTLGATSQTATYTFKNWNNAAAGNGSYTYTNGQTVTNPNGATSGTTYLYAQWNSASVKLPTATLPGYTFLGWYDAATGGNKIGGAGDSYTPTAAKTLYAHWQANKITVKFSGNGATGGATADQVFTYDSAQALRANGFSRAYTVTYSGNFAGRTPTLGATSQTATYTFKNWNNAAAGNGSYTYTNGQTVTNPNGATSGTTYLYAQWNSASVKLPTATLPGYTFLGWYDAATGGNKIGGAGDSYTPTAAKTLYAHWNANTNTAYKVNVYVMNTSGGYPTSPTTHSYTGTTDTSVTIDPSRYYPDKSGQFSLDSDKGNVLTGTIKGDGSLVLVVYIKRASHTVTYDSATNGGSTATQTRTVYYQGAVDFTLKAEKSDWTFIGWNTDKNATEKLDSLTMGTSNVTLYAIFSKTVTVHFYSGSKGAVHNQFQITFKNNETAGSVKSPTSFGTIDGWTALGWTASTAASKAVGDAAIKGGTTITVAPAKNEYVYYAVYTQSQTLKYESNANGDTSVKNIPANGTLAGAYYNSSDAKLNITRTIPSTVPTRNGYTFKSWNTQANGSGTNYAAGARYTNSAQIDTLYAQWTENQYTITYVNGNGNADSKVGYKITAEITIIAAPTYDGYVFVGWKVTTVTNGNWTSGDLYGAGAKIGSGKYGNVTLVAQWVYVKDAETKADEYNQDNTISIVTGVDGNGNTTSITTTKYDAESFKKYQDAINAYNNAKKSIPTDINASNYSEKLSTATKNLQDAINALVNITLTERGVVTDYLNNFLIDSSGTRHNLNEMNLNHYDLATTVETAKNALVNGNAIKAKSYGITAKDTDGKTFQTKINEYVAAMAKAFKTKTQVKTEGPGFKVYENADAAKAVTDANGKTLAGATAVNYAYAGKGNYTYYCYTNSTNPTVLITVDDIVNAGRVCYPTTAKATAAPTLSGSAKNANAAYTITKIPAGNADNAYLTYTKLSIGGASSYYQQKQVITLTPEFTSGTNGTVTYEFTATDDALNPNVATQSALSSGIGNANSWQKNLADDTTNTKKITIVIDYHSGDQMTVTGDQVNRDTYLNQYHLFRQSGGASNWELPKTGDKVYKVNDGTYKQTDRGSFTFTYELGATDIGNGKINTTDVNEIIKLFKDESNYSAAKKLSFVGTKYWTKNSNGTRVQHEGSGLGYQVWGNNWSFNYYPKSESYTYVHLVDRWGNVVDKVFYVGKQDIKEVTVTTASADGAYTILEDGGSGIDTLSLNAGTLEILTDENSTLENNVYRTTGNTVRIKTGEANKSYTLSMKDKATNASTATLESDGNGIITLSIDDAMYKSGVYTFMLNGTEINLYDGVNNDKYILNVYDGEAEEGEAAEMIVITTGEVGKTRFTDTDGNTVTVAASETNEDGTKTWRMSKSRPAGEYEYRISVKVGHDWIEENSTGKLIFTEKQLDTGRIVKAEYDEESGLYKLTIEGRATKIQFITEDGMTRTYTRYSEAVKSRKSYDAEGNEVPDTGRLLDHEVWLVNARLYSGQNYTVAGKFEAGWNREGTATLTGH